ncbi:carbon catabolite repressor protein 4-like protein 3-like [Senna tora]|uniref:Carbon catabolite repressor protein 4-like protein 3-like n=1 Tax=Senna tora TaxID=362788 RepID=A0A834WE27_9FABA|nr:carbon catabolite repressor protein 4-like protein 3-like [Senna tora]
MASKMNNCSSCLSVGSPTPTSLSLNRHSSLFFVSCTTKLTILPTCSNASAHSSSSSFSRSYTRPWYNPLSPRNFDRDPEIERQWIEADQPLASEERFTVASYNILADRNASEHRDLYTNVPSHYVKWDRRRRVICTELFGWDPDIICLQEVDKYVELSNILVKAGYTGSYKSSYQSIKERNYVNLMTSENGLQRRTGDTIDGCAMFWKADKFQLLEAENIEFKGIGLRDNVAQLSVFEMRNSDSRRILIGNIHVLYNPSRGEVKLGQIRFLLSRAQALSEKWGNAPVVLAGDFNSTPQSGIYKFLSSSELNIMFYDRRDLSGQKSCHPAQVLGYKKETVNPFILMDRLFKGWTDEEVKIATGNSQHHLVMHPLKLNSSYATIKGSARTRGFNGEPLATSYHSKFLGTVDYLWYSGNIIPTRVLDTVPIDILRKTGGLPCKRVGSDHLALVSEFAFSLTTTIATTDIVAAAENKEQENLQSENC